MISKEIIWFLCPICAILSQIGGTFWKPARRFILPLVVAIAIFIFGGGWLCALLDGVILMIAAVLPFTLIGDSLYDSWLNWIWVCFLAALMSAHGVIFMLIGVSLGSCLKAAILPFICILGGFVLSNLKKTAYYFPWKFIEALAWGMAVYPTCLIVSTI